MTGGVVRGYDGLGRLISYTDADANTSTTTYDIASRVAVTFDGKATRTYGYDGGSERRGLPTQVVDSGGGTMTASYDVDGNPVSQTWPGNVVVTVAVDEAGAPASIAYVQTGCGQADCTLYAESVTTSVHGQWRDGTSTLSARVYGYDPAGRLTTVRDTVAGDCVTRVYAFDGTSGRASNRTGLTTYAPGENGACQTTTVASSRTYTYDSADRLTTGGIVFDALGRITTQPAVDTNVPASGSATLAYHTNDMAKSIVQNGRTTSYTLDVIANRFRSWADDATGGTVTRTHHYIGDGDSPAWTDEGDGTLTRPVGGLVGVAAIQAGPIGGNVVWQVTNLHGDFVAGFTGSTAGSCLGRVQYGGALQHKVAASVPLPGQPVIAQQEEIMAEVVATGFGLLLAVGVVAYGVRLYRKDSSEMSAAVRRRRLWATMVMALAVASYSLAVLPATSATKDALFQSGAGIFLFGTFLMASAGFKHQRDKRERDRRASVRGDGGPSD